MRSPKLEKAYKEYNRKFFGNLLPNPPEVKIQWEDIPCMGMQLEDEIAISRKDRKRDSVWRGTLLHEMCHLALPAIVRHGPQFQNEMLRLAKLGAFKDIW